MVVGLLIAGQLIAGLQVAGLLVTGLQVAGLLVAGLLVALLGIDIVPESIRSRQLVLAYNVGELSSLESAWAEQAAPISAGSKSIPRRHVGMFIYICSSPNPRHPGRQQSFISHSSLHHCFQFEHQGHDMRPAPLDPIFHSHRV
jgi:hypothetical protein